MIATAQRPKKGRRPNSVRDAQREEALRLFVTWLHENGDLRVAADSCVAGVIGTGFSNSITSSAVSASICRGLVTRHRETDRRDHYDSPVTYRLTYAGRQWLQKSESR